MDVDYSKMVIIQPNNYIKANGLNGSDTSPTPWYQFKEAVKHEEANLAPGHKILIDFINSPLSNISPLIKSVIMEFIMDDNVVMQCWENTQTHRILQPCVMFKITDPKKAAEKLILIKASTSQVLPKSEIEKNNRLKKYRTAIRNCLEPLAAQSKDIFTYFKDVKAGCGFDNLETMRVGLNEFFYEFAEIANDLGIKSIFMSMKDVKYNEKLIDYDLKLAISACYAKGISLVFTDCTAKLNAYLALHTKMVYDNGTIEDLKKAINELGQGRVVLLTRFTPHNSENMSYREKNEIYGQFIGIIDQIKPDGIKVKYCGYKDFSSIHDRLVRSSFDLEDTTENMNLAINTTDIPYEVIGFGDLRIARDWHIDLFNIAGTTPEAQQFNYANTYTNKNGQYNCENGDKTKPVEETVVLPEYIRRVLIAWGIPFNRKALQQDIEDFTKSLKKIKKLG